MSLAFHYICMSMENFVVSARKYRPATFNTVVGQKHITETLKNAIQRGQVAHAYLFTGPRGVGKTTCARIFAKAINCLNPTADHEACGDCESCRSFDDGRSFNIHELDAASNNSVDDIRALNDKVRIAPQVGRYSVYIIDEVHMLSTGAFNAFLKTLEEPPSYAVFILATTEKHKILPTILSRCQAYDFNRIRVEDMVEYIAGIASKEGVTFDDESLHIIAQKADGGMRDALSTFDRVVSFCGTDLKYQQVAESIGSLDFNTYFAAIDLALAEDYPALLKLLDQIMGKGFDAGNFIAGLGEHMRNLLVAKNPQTASLLEVTGSLAAKYAEQASRTDTEFLFNAINLLTKADSTYKVATNRRLHAEMTLIKFSSLKKKDSIDESYPLPQIKIRGSAGEPAKTSTIAYAPESPRVVTDDAQSAKPAERTFVPETGSAADEPAKTEPDTQQPAKQEPVVPDTTHTPPTLPDDQIVTQQLRPVEQPIGSIEVEEQAPETASSGQPATQPVQQPKTKRSITNISISNPVDTKNKEVKTEARRQTSEIPQEEAQQKLEKNYGLLIELWSNRKRPRIATALTVKSIAGNRIIIAVPDQVLADEIEQNKWQIEEDIINLTGCSAVVEVEIRYVESVKLPVSVEQKLQYLVDKNPNIIKLRDELDLTT